jgi:hypothetical protein
MSTRKIADHPERQPPVIVRSFGDEPVALVAHRLDPAKNRVFVGIPEALRPISLPMADVFDYDPDAFTRLSEAFAEGNQSLLREIYRELSGKKACNRYQDMLDWVHEKEPEIRDSRSAAHSGQQ